MRWAAAPTGLHNSIFSNHNWSYLWLSVSGAGWNTPAAVWLGLSSLLNNELLVHMSFRADRDSQMCVLKYWHYCEARGEKTRVWLAETGWSPHLSWCLIQECACGRAVLSCVVLPCQTCRRSSRVLAAPVRLLLLALTCGSMWGFCRNTQQRRQEGDLLRSQLIGSALIVLWRRVGEAVGLPRLPPPFHVQSLISSRLSIPLGPNTHRSWQNNSSPGVFNCNRPCIRAHVQIYEGINSLKMMCVTYSRTKWLTGGGKKIKISQSDQPMKCRFTTQILLWSVCLWCHLLAVKTSPQMSHFPDAFPPLEVDRNAPNESAFPDKECSF